jgi:hypothetical protein
LGIFRFIGLEVSAIIFAVYTAVYLWGASFLLDLLNAPDSMMVFVGFVGLLIGTGVNGLLAFLFLSRLVGFLRSKIDPEEK